MLGPEHGYRLQERPIQSECRGLAPVLTGSDQLQFPEPALVGKTYTLAQFSKRITQFIRLALNLELRSDMSSKAAIFALTANLHFVRRLLCVRDQRSKGQLSQIRPEDLGSALGLHADLPKLTLRPYPPPASADGSAATICLHHSGRSRCRAPHRSAGRPAQRTPDTPEQQC